ncbi:RNA polymerase sigma factor SigM [Haloglycomyces albus]|uniref:RNA polymerase sigma factor SigM n=1 Tax=Haloglycomyces albus TaxID=526067 RepID=UPI00046CE77A|nr:RNA polymerase sigma factor SigM [Haloglycomyces albus]
MTQSSTPRPPDPDLPDAQLLDRHVNGDREAFGELFRRHRNRLWAVAVRTLGNPDDAAEALQDSMIKAYQSARGFKGKSAVSTWLHRIVVNSCLDRIRSNQRRRALAERNIRENPEEAYVNHEDVSLSVTVRQALQELPANQRTILVYVDMLGYPVDEVAEILSIRPGTVKSRAARGRKKMASHLRSVGWDGNPPEQRDVSEKRPPHPTAAPPQPPERRRA